MSNVICMVRSNMKRLSNRSMFAPERFIPRRNVRPGMTFRAVLARTMAGRFRPTCCKSRIRNRMAGICPAASCWGSRAIRRGFLPRMAKVLIWRGWRLSGWGSSCCLRERLPVPCSSNSRTQTLRMPPNEYKNLNPEKALIWRIVHRDNLPWILEHGLHCGNSQIRSEQWITIGNTELISKRADHAVPLPPGGTLNELPLGKFLRTVE